MRQYFFVKAVNLILGSWYSIVGHTVLFAVLLFIFKDMLLFTVIVSIEAIYIGIFILMAEYKEELAREKKEQNRRAKDRRLVKEDVDLTQKVMSELRYLRKQQEDIKEILSNYPRYSDKNKTTTP